MFLVPSKLTFGVQLMHTIFPALWSTVKKRAAVSGLRALYCFIAASKACKKSQLNFLQWLINKFSSLISLVGIDISMRGSLMWKENQRTLYLAGKNPAVHAAIHFYGYHTGLAAVRSKWIVHNATWTPKEQWQLTSNDVKLGDYINYHWATFVHFSITFALASALNSWTTNFWFGLASIIFFASSTTCIKI